MKTLNGLDLSPVNKKITRNTQKESIKKTGAKSWTEAAADPKWRGRQESAAEVGTSAEHQGKSCDLCVWFKARVALMARLAQNLPPWTTTE